MKPLRLRIYCHGELVNAVLHRDGGYTCSCCGRRLYGLVW